MSKMLKDKIERIRRISQVKELSIELLNDTKQIDRLIQFLNSSERISSIAAWVLNHCVEQRKDILTAKQCGELLEILSKTPDHSVRRNLLRVFMKSRTSFSGTAELAYLAYDLFLDTAQDIAVRAFAIGVLEKYIESVSELTEPVFFQLEKEMMFACPAIQVRGREFMKKISGNARISGK